VVNPWRAVRLVAGLSLLATAALLVARPAAGAASEAPGLVEAGERLFRAALFERAERAFRDALAHDAQSGPGHFGLARSLAARRDLDLARGEAEVAVRLPETPIDVHLTLAGLHEQIGDTSRAARALADYLTAAGADEQPIRVRRARSQAALLGVVGRAPLRTLASDRAVTLPFDIVHDKLLVKASINGRIPIDVVVDTGAEGLVLSSRTVARAGLRRAGGGGAERGPELALAETFDLAGLTVSRVPALVRQEPLRVTPNRDGEAFSPLGLGLSMILDYERREMTVGKRLPFEAADVELPLSFVGLPVVVGSHDAEAVSFVIDTGSEVTSIASARVETLAVAPGTRRIPMRLFDAWGERQSDAFLLTPGLDLEFGAIRLPQFPVVVRSWPEVEAVHGFEMGGILGHNFLKRYRVSIDLVRRVVRLKRLVAPSL
jgi:predicted aspartyl protease